MQYEEPNDKIIPQPGSVPFPFSNPENTIAVYTMVAILKEIRTSLGLEVMLEYCDGYLALIAKNNPFLQDAVKQALELINVEKLYQDMCRDGKKK